jgi:transcription elongation factor GreB
MSKAFTKESEEGPFDEVVPEPRDVLPPGTKNYVTPGGAQALRAELARLEGELRPRMASGKDAAKRKRLEALDRRIVFLKDRISGMVVVDPRTQEQDSVHFGATVTVADAEGNEKSYQLVGVDESDPASGKISWISPIAKALISARVGDVVTLELPAGDVELEILQIEYR